MLRRLLSLLRPSPSRAAAALAAHRRDAERARVLAVMQQLRRECGLPEWKP